MGPRPSIRPPKIFNAVADGLTWALQCSGVDQVLHYLDDFFFCSTAHSPACKDNLAIAFRGIEIDSTKRELRLPQAKLTCTKNLLQSWEGRRTATKHELQCLIGHLSHAARVVRPGRTFLWELIRTVSVPKHSYHKARLNLFCQAEIDRVHVTSQINITSCVGHVGVPRHVHTQ